MSSGHRRLPHLPSSVGYNRINGNPLNYEVGFRNRGQGKLAPIIVNGSVNNAPVFKIEPSLQEEVPQLLRDLADVLEESTL